MDSHEIELITTVIRTVETNFKREMDGLRGDMQALKVEYDEVLKVQREILLEIRANKLAYKKLRNFIAGLAGVATFVLSVLTWVLKVI